MAKVVSNFSDIITFTRSSGGGRYNASGVYEWVGNNVPRFDYDPVTRQAKGILIEEQRTNLLTYSSEFTNAAWGKNGTSVVDATVISPSGTASAKKLIPNSGGTYTNIVRLGATSVSGAYCLSVYAKAAEISTLYLSITNTSSEGVSFNLSAKTATVVGSGPVGNIEDAGGGWFRCSMTTALSAQNAYAMIQPRPSGSPGVAGDGTSGIYIWGAQLEAGAFPTSYIPTKATFVSRASTGTYFDSNGVMQTAAINEARTNHVLVGGQWVSSGLLVEEQRTNLLTYSEQFDNGAWASAGISISANSATSPDGALSADKITTTVADATTPARGVTSLTSAGVTYTYSVWLRSDSPISMVLQVPAPDFNSYIAQKSISVTSTWQRFDVTFTGQAGSLWLRSGVVGSVFYVWGAQLEAGAFPTSYIPTVASQVTRAADVTTSSQVTRSADVASVNTLSPWYNASEGTLFVESIRLAPLVANTPLALFNGSGTNLLRIRADGTTFVFDGFNNGLNFVSITAPSGQNNKVAIVYQDNYFNISSGGIVANPDTSGIVPAVSTLLLGRHPYNSNQFNGHIRSIRYFPRRLTNAELQSLTTP